MKKAEGRRSSIINRILNSITEEESQRTRKRMALAMKIDEAIKAKGWKNKDLAKALNINNMSIISRWLSGTHNFTIDTLCDIERVLEINIVNVDIQAKEQIISVVNMSISKENDSKQANILGQLYNYNQLQGISNNLIQYK